ncbi:MAG: CvpA family protein, partial [Acutalibacteraceae bacterium]
TLFDVAAYIIAVIAARAVSVAAAPPVFRQYFGPSIEARLAKQLDGVSAMEYGEKIETAVNSIPDYLNGMLSMIGIDKDELAARISSSELTSDNIVETLMEKIVSPVATAIIETLIFVILVIVFRLLLQIVVRLLDGVIKKLPAINKLNTTLGGILGAVKGVFVVVILALLVGVIASAVQYEPFVQAVSNSLIVKAVSSLITSVSGQIF